LQATPKEADIGRLGQQVVGDKKELRENFEDVWYICALATVIPFWF
jgi:hypothetical protein